MAGWVVDRTVVTVGAFWCDQRASAHWSQGEVRMSAANDKMSCHLFFLKKKPRELFFKKKSHEKNLAVFSFLYLKKIKFQKYMSVFKYFKNIPRSPSHRATGPMCNFFFKFATKSLEKKKQALSPVGGATAPPFFFSDFYFCRDLFWAIRACIRHHRRQDLGR